MAVALPQLPNLGTLNRLITSVSFPSLSGLNITYNFFGTKVATLAWEGNASDYIDALVGYVPSPRPVQVANISVWINKSQPLAQLWENQRQQNTSVGDIVVTTDSPVLGPYYLQNGSLINIPDINLDGMSNDFPLVFKATYQLNAQLFQGV